MKIETDLWPGVRGIEYVKNHHFIRLTDDDGTQHQMNAQAMLQYACPKCDTVLLSVGKNLGTLACPSCGAEMKQSWRRPQIGFVPEEESEYQPPPQKDDS